MTKKNWGVIASIGFVKMQDEMNLDAHEKALYLSICLAAGRDDQSVCRMSIAELSKVSRIGTAKAKKALVTLQGNRMIRSEKALGLPSIITPTDYSTWIAPNPTQVPPEPRINSTQVPPEPRINSTQVPPEPRINSTQVPPEPRINSTQVRASVHDIECGRARAGEYEYKYKYQDLDLDLLTAAAALDPDPDRARAPEAAAFEIFEGGEAGRERRTQLRRLGMGGARSALAGGPPRTQVVFRSPIGPIGARSDWAPKAPWRTEEEREAFEGYLRVVHSDKASPWGYSAAIVARIGKDGPDPNGKDDWARYVKASRAASLTGGAVPQQLSEEATQKVLDDWKWVTRQFPRFEPSLFEPFPLRDLWLAEMAQDSEGYSREARTSMLRRMFLGWREHCFPDCPALAAYRAGPKYQAPVVPITPHYAGAGQVVHR